MEKLIEFENASKLSNISSVFSRLDDSYMYSHISPGSDTRLLIDTTPMKPSGTILLLMRGGTPFDVEINLQPYTLRPGSFMSVFPGTIIKVIGEVPDDIDAFALYFDMKFLQNVNINVSSVAIPPMMGRPKSVIDLTETEADVLARYLELLHLNSLDVTNPQIAKNIGTSIVAAFFYQMMQYYHKRLSGIIDESKTAGKAVGRRHDYVREFIRLVQLHHVQERSVTFYADKLFISAKYLTLLVKEATGRSAAKWIDEFVIMEAKNLLRFSGKNIQQVAYALNFTTQSSFGKYFKHITGMSPTEFQKS